jgi:hypothetical protein
MKSREMAEMLVQKLAHIPEDVDDDAVEEYVTTAVEIFADQLLTEGHRRAGATIEQAVIGLRYEDS